MVVRAMQNDLLFKQISQCNKSLDFEPLKAWPQALPVFTWQGLQLCGFERREGQALDLFVHSPGCTWLDAFLACHPQLGLGEIARLNQLLQLSHLDLAREFAEGLWAAYGLRASERLSQTLTLLAQSPREFQDWVDSKAPGVRELAPLLALPNIHEFSPFLKALTELPWSKAQAMRGLELVAELNLMGRPLNDLLPSGDNPTSYLQRLEQWRRPRATHSDEAWSKTVTAWPWPSQVQGQWQRFGDQTGLEIRLRANSPQDLDKKLVHLRSIQDTWLKLN